MVKVTISHPGETIVDEITALVPQPTVPATAPIPKIGIVEIGEIQPTQLIPGPPGPQGPRGSRWTTGNGPPSTTSGFVTGDMYLDDATDNVWTFDGTAWTNTGTNIGGSPDTGAQILTKLAPVDGTGSGLDSDLLDGQHGAYYSAWANLTGVPATFPPTLPIPESGVTNLVSDLALKAPLASPGLTGVPTAPTASPGTSTTQIASTAFVGAGLAGKLDSSTAATTYAPINAPVFTGDARAVTPASNDNDTSIATTAFVQTGLSVKIGDAPNDGVQYVRQSLAWTPVSVPPGTAISDTPPASPVVGQLWWQSSTGALFLWYNDGSSSQWVQVNTTGSTGRLELSLFAGGTLSTNEVLFRYEFTSAATLPAGLTGSQGSSGTAATGSPALSIRKNGTQFATATWSGTEPTFAAASATSFAINDVLSVVAPSTADATLADVNISLVGTPN